MSNISTYVSEESAGNYNNISHTESSNTDQSFSYEKVEAEIKEQIEYEVLSERNYGRVLDEIVSLLTDTYCATENFVRISKRQISTRTFCARISKLTAEHIEHVIRSLEKMKER